jgi:Integral membrane protein
MVKINSSNEETLFTVTLEPNRSLDWKYSLVFIFIIAITCLSVGFAFYFVGATFILPFAG